MTSTIAITHSNGAISNGGIRNAGIFRHHSNGNGHKHHSLDDKRHAYANGINMPTRSASDVCTFMSRNGIKANAIHKDGNANLTNGNGAEPMDLITKSDITTNNNPHPKLKPALISNITAVTSPPSKRSSSNDLKSKGEEDSKINESESQQIAHQPIIVNTKPKVKRNAGNHPKSNIFAKSATFDFDDGDRSIEVTRPELPRTISDQYRAQTPTSSSDTSSPKNGVHFAEWNPPPGIKHLQGEFFAPGVKAYFQRSTQLPLLTHTDSIILTRKPSIADASEQINTISTKIKFRRQQYNLPGNNYYYGLLTLDQPNSWQA